MYRFMSLIFVRREIPEVTGIYKFVAKMVRAK